MPGIFISYSRKDEIFARRLATSLEQMETDVWLDVDDIPAGLKWSTAIQQGLDTADVMLVVISPDSMASPNVEDEWQYFIDHRKPIIPILLRQAKIHFQLNRIQWVDFLNQPYERALAELHEELSKKGVRVRKPADVTAVSYSRRDVQQYAESVQPKPVKPASRLPIQLLAGSGIGALAMLAMVTVLLFTFNNDDNNQTPTDDVTAVIAVSDAPTDEPTTTDAPTATDAPTHTPTDEPFVLNPVAHNDDWEVIQRTFNGVEMVLVPPGTFILGATDEQLAVNAELCWHMLDDCSLLHDEQPIETVTVESPFWIDLTEVTNATYNGSGNNLPKVNVTWQDAAAHCASRDARLPTEVEWEFAASGPDNWNHPWGDTWQDYANICDSSCSQNWREAAINDGYAVAAPVGQYPQGASWVGALDMVGNVWEYTSTIYADYPYDASIVENPSNPALRTLRGNAYTWIQGEATTSARAAGIAVQTDFYGFRCVRDYQDGDI